MPPLTVNLTDRTHLTMRILAAALALLGLVVACGDDDSPTEPVGAPLIADEAFALVGAAVLADVEFLTDPEELGVDGTAAFGPLTIPCSMGGTVAVSGELSVTEDPLIGALRISTSATFVHTDCVEEDEESGIVFTVNGAPNVVMDVEVVDQSELDLDLSGALQGTVRWALGAARSGSCLIDLNITSDITAQTVTIAGRACGHQISQTDDLDFSSGPSGLLGDGGPGLKTYARRRIAYRLTIE